MEDKTLDMAIEKLREDEDFQKALKMYQDMEEKSSETANIISKQIIDILDLQNPKQTIEESRRNMVIAKMTAAKVLATLSSFSYEEKDFMASLQNARECVQKELVPMLMHQEPCGQCEACKNGHSNRCINPKIRSAYCESRFLPLLSNALIEYDAWSEVLYSAIPSDKKDVDVLQDINDKFQNETKQVVKKRRGRPPKNKKEES